MVIAKGLGGGYMPIGAMLLQNKIFETIAERLGRRSSTATPIWAIRSPVPRRSRSSR